MNSLQYTPQQNGIHKDAQNDVSYVEYIPPERFAGIVFVFWELYSSQVLARDFIYTVMPDACVDVVFNMDDDSAPLFMTPHTTVETLNLGLSFHYAGIRFWPGAFVGANKIVGLQRDVTQLGDINLMDTVALLRTSTIHVVDILSQLADTMLDAGIVRQNILVQQTLRVLAEGGAIRTAMDRSGYSERQFRRLIKDQTGYSPIELYRILRFQMALSGDSSLRFADQSHLIKEFHAITGMPYSQFMRQFR